MIGLGRVRINGGKQRMLRKRTLARLDFIRFWRSKGIEPTFADSILFRVWDRKGKAVPQQRGGMFR